VAHAYAGDATGKAAAAQNPRGPGFAPGVLDWEAYLGALEEIGYGGFLTVWPDSARDTRSQWNAIVARLKAVI
jgi:sugar phosphate isomerase/epimerase